MVQNYPHVNLKWGPLTLPTNKKFKDFHEPLPIGVCVNVPLRDIQYALTCRTLGATLAKNNSKNLEYNWHFCRL